VRAIGKITAGNAEVKVLAGQDVSFITAGSIDLFPGFEVEAGADFSTHIKKNIHHVTADCNDLCEHIIKVPNAYYRYQDYLYIDNLVNAEKVEYMIERARPKEFIYSDIVYVTKEGRVALWDLVTGEHSLIPGGTSYIAIIWIYPCKGGAPIGFTLHFYVIQLTDKSLNEEPEETENLNTFSLSDVENMIFLDENAVPNFSIIPNPNPGTFQLETNFPLSDIANLKITSLLGATVYETQNVSSNTIQLQNTAAGQHFVVIILKDGSVLTQKMVIQ